MNKQKLFNRISVSIAIITFFGVALHDTKLDKLATMTIAVPVALAVYEGSKLLHAFSSGDHTHVERVSVEKTAQRNTNVTPYLHYRRDKLPKIDLSGSAQKGHHPFDNYTLPMVA